MTNRDKLNNMTNEELATFINNIVDPCIYCIIYDFCNNCTPFISCENVICRWLESEVEEK